MNVTLNTPTNLFWGFLPDQYSDWTKSPSFAFITTLVTAALVISWRMSQKVEEPVLDDPIPRSFPPVGRKIKVIKRRHETLQQLKIKCIAPFEKNSELCDLIENFKWQQIQQKIDQFKKIELPFTEYSLWEYQEGIRITPSLDHLKVFFGLRFFYVHYYLKRNLPKKAYYHFFLYSLLYIHLRFKSPPEFYLTASIPDRIRKARNALCQELKNYPLDLVQKCEFERWIEKFNKKWKKSWTFETFFNPDEKLAINFKGNVI